MYQTVETLASTKQHRTNTSISSCIKILNDYYVLCNITKARANIPEGCSRSINYKKCLGWRLSKSSQENNIRIRLRCITC